MTNKMKDKNSITITVEISEDYKTAHVIVVGEHELALHSLLKAMVKYVQIMASQNDLCIEELLSGEPMENVTDLEVARGPGHAH